MADGYQPLEEDAENPNWSVPAEKTEQQETAFNRIVTSIHDFVMFLRDLYIPEEAIMVPPEGGWPSITKESWRSYCKSDEVIEVLRHLTYVKLHKSGDRYQFLPDSGLCNFQESHWAQKATSGNGREIAFMTEVPEDPSPSHVVGLIAGGRACRIVLLDCRDGIVYGEGDVEFGWSEGVKQPVEEYFDLLKDRFRQMQLLPQSVYEVIEEGPNSEGVMSPLREIYKKHGWPDNYKKNDCVAELAEFGQPGNILRLMGYS